MELLPKPKKSYAIGDLVFKTKTACEEYTRNIINNLGCCVIDKDNDKFIFFINLIKNHPKSNEKIGIGIDYFYIQPNPLIRKYYQTMIHRLDGTDIDFSWTYCCKFKERTFTDNLIRSMRQALKTDIINYKNSYTKLICNFCKIDNELYENYHVDHDIISFKTLSTNFLQLSKHKIPTIFDKCEIYKLTIFKECDTDFKNEWVSYHNSNCTLQILCRDCNLRKPK
jgi:hypothetical protein